MEERLLEFVQQVRRRNLRETAAGLVLLLIFALTLFADPESRLAMIGCAVGIVGVLLVLAVIWGRLHIPASDLGAYPPREHPETWRRHMTSQARLLRLAWLWYVLPLALGIGLLVAGAGDGLVGRAIALAIIVAGAIAVVWLNLRAARQVEVERDALVGPRLN